MFPIRDHNPSRRFPYITYSLILLNALIFLSYWHILGDPSKINPLFQNWALVPANIKEGSAYFGLLTSIFFHGSFMHLIGNMLFLHIYGDNLEDKMGHLEFLIFYLAAGIFANFAQFAANPYSDVPVIGASGAVAAVMGGYLLLFPRARIDILFIFVIIFKIIPVRAWLVLGIWFVLQLYNGLAVPAAVSGVAYWAHIGGFVFGVIATLTTWKKLGGAKFWYKNHGAPDHKEATYSLKRTNIPKVRR
tara:strand:- start:736 stop:1476 length:741 start_codon:yes stop_codon:yes gene_type:complete